MRTTILAALIAGICLFATTARAGELVTEFDEPFDVYDTAVWRTASGFPSPDTLALEDHDGASTLRMTSMLSQGNVKGIETVQTFASKLEGRVTVTFKTMPYSDPTVPVTNPHNLEGVFYLRLLSLGPYTPFFDLALIADIHGDRYVRANYGPSWWPIESIWPNRNVWEYDSWYRFVIEGEGGWLRFSLEDLDGNELWAAGYTSVPTPIPPYVWFTNIGTFRIQLLQVNWNWPQCFADVAVDRVTYSTADNADPVAVPGKDRIVNATSAHGASVDLIGTGSYDPDGQVVSWTWSEDGADLAYGSTATVILPEGAHWIDLTVTDDDGDTDTERIWVRVRGDPKTSFTDELDDFEMLDTWCPAGIVDSHPWILGPPQGLGIEEHDGESTLRMTSCMINGQIRGLATIDEFVTPEKGTLTVDFKTMAFEDHGLGAQYPYNVQGLLAVKLVNPATGDFCQFGIWGGGGYLAELQIWKYYAGITQFQAAWVNWQYETWYRLFIESDGTKIRFSLRGIDDVEIAAFDSPYPLQDIGETFQIQLVQWNSNGWPPGYYNQDVAVDRIEFLPENRAPVADAGPDQAVEATGPGTEITLDGSGSSDPDEDPLTYSWYEGTYGNLIEETEDPTTALTLGLGTHWLYLVVSDGVEDSIPDWVAIVVQDTTPPEIELEGANVVIECTGGPPDYPPVTATDLVLLVGLTAQEPDPWQLGPNEVVWTAWDSSGNTSTATQIVTLVDTSPPTITAPPDITVEATSPDGEVIEDLGTPSFGGGCGSDLTVTNDAPDVFLLGATTVTWTATDAAGNWAEDTQTVTVEESTPPVITDVMVDPDSLWPANHLMVLVTVEAVVTDLVDPAPSVEVVAVSCNEPWNGTGDGNTLADYDLETESPMTVYLRAERAGNLSDRIYTLTVRATDASGNEAEATVTVTVPHDQRGKAPKEQEPAGPEPDPLTSPPNSGSGDGSSNSDGSEPQAADAGDGSTGSEPQAADEGSSSGTEPQAVTEGSSSGTEPKAADEGGSTGAEPQAAEEGGGSEAPSGGSSEPTAPTTTGGSAADGVQETAVGGSVQQAIEEEEEENANPADGPKSLPGDG